MHGTMPMTAAALLAACGNKADGDWIEGRQYAPSGGTCYLHRVIENKDTDAGRFVVATARFDVGLPSETRAYSAHRSISIRVVLDCEQPGAAIVRRLHHSEAAGPGARKVARGRSYDEARQRVAPLADPATSARHGFVCQKARAAATARRTGR